MPGEVRSVKAADGSRLDYEVVGDGGHDGSDNTLPSNYGVGSSDVDDLQAVLNAGQLDRVNFFAHSSGGATAFVFACRYPERVMRTVLIEPTLYSLLPPADRNAIEIPSMAIATKADADGPEAALRATMEMVAGEAWTRV
jgi:pimeloyl-ACP methyl ester carboxylesterase